MAEPTPEKGRLWNAGTEWLRGEGECVDVVMSSRVRLARNVAGFPFMSKANKVDAQQTLDMCKDHVLSAGVCEHLLWVDLHESPKDERTLLMERHLISAQHARGKQASGVGDSKSPRAVVVSVPHERLSIMVNEEDHLRIQVIRSGLALNEAFEQIDEVDDKLEAGLDFAFSPRFGYLSACPTNVGTGIRVSLMLHLPGLRLTGEIEKVQRAARDMSLAVRGFYGEGSDAAGDFYQISNQTTLGKSERVILHEQVKRRAEELTVVTKRLERLNEAKTELVSTVSHELRTPLTSIKEAVALVLEGAVGDINKEQKKFLRMAAKNVDRLVNLTDSLLDLSRVGAGKVEMKRELVDITDIADEVIASLKVQADRRKITLRNCCPGSLPPIYADRERVTQVFTNLLGNALKFTPEGGSVTVEGQDIGEDLKIDVIDTGEGIPADKFEIIFDKYAQLDISFWKGEKGAGLGLAIAKDIVKGHKGSIWVESELGKGSKFSFTLPRDLRAKEKKRRQAEER